MTKTELKARADAMVQMAKKATEGERTALLRKARNYYAEANLLGLAAWCERHMG